MKTKKKCHKCPNDANKVDERGRPWCDKCIQKYFVVSPREVGHKIGRNDPCSCGSGKKFKKCCYGTQ